MKKILVLCLVAACSLASAQTATNGGLEELYKTITNKMKSGQVAETNFTAELAQFDALIAAQAGAKTDDAAQIILSKAMLYLQVFQNTGQAAGLLKKITAEYSTTKYSETAGQFLKQIEMFEAQTKMAAEGAKIQSELMPGKDFPDFAAVDFDGKPISAGAFKGKVVLLDFWATTCPPCIQELPHTIETYKKLHAKRFEIIGVNCDKERATAEKFIERNEGMTWPQIFDNEKGENKMAIKYYADGIPFFILIGPDGKIIAKEYKLKPYGPSLRGDDLAKTVAAALGK